jgi:thiol peroxidase
MIPPGFRFYDQTSLRSRLEGVSIMHERHGFVTFKGTPVTLLGQPAQVGGKAPEFAALRGDLSAFSLVQTAGKIVVINSVPSLDTSVCAAQARRFNQEAAGLGSDVKVLVISMDLPFAQKRFCATEGITNLETLSDHRDASFGSSYGMLIKELRLLARGVLVIDKAGVLRYQQLVPEVGQEPDYAEVLAAVKALQ